jgi:hypothetical protein
MKTTGHEPKFIHIPRIMWDVVRARWGFLSNDTPSKILGMTCVWCSTHYHLSLE